MTTHNPMVIIDEASEVTKEMWEKDPIAFCKAVFRATPIHNGPPLIAFLPLKGTKSRSQGRQL